LISSLEGRVIEEEVDADGQPFLTREDGMGSGELLRMEKPKTQGPRRGTKKKKKNGQKRDPQLADKAAQLIVPTNEQTRIRSLVASQGNNMAAKYLGALINPKMILSRVPDSYPRPTALVRSILTMDVPILLDTTGNSGRFSVAVQPTLGALDLPQHFKIGMVKSDTTWPTDFSNANSYFDTINNRDIRIDQFYTTLTQQQLGSATYTGQAPGSDLIPFGASITSVAGYGITLGYAPASGVFTLPIGMYVITVLFKGALLTLPTFNPVGGATSSLVAAELSTDATVSAAVFYVCLHDDGDAFNFVMTNALAAIASSSITVAPSFDDDANLSPNPDFGVTTEYRPVACSALATYIGPQLTDGGNIAAAYVPGNTLAVQYYNPVGNQNQGLLQNWENLSLLPQSYNGPISQGAYVWWSPESVRDIEMAAPSTWASRNGPALIISGQYAPGSVGVLPQVQAVVRVEVVTIYELFTNSQLWEVVSCVGSQALFDQVNMRLALEPHAMANATHQSWIAKVWNGIKSAATWAWKNRAALGSIGADMAMLL
jgi:hypothetical protein